MPIGRRFLLACAIAACAQVALAQAVVIGPNDVVLIRHATAPGVGDPPDFRLDDCSTQRNLSDEGRAEARRIGDEFRARHIRIGLVLMSQWCRTRETARLAFGTEQPRDEPAFNSFYSKGQSQRDAQTARAREILRRWNGPGVLVVVTHQVNIQAIANVPAASAEGVVMRKDEKGELRVAGTFKP